MGIREPRDGTRSSRDGCLSMRRRSKTKGFLCFFSRLVANVTYRRRGDFVHAAARRTFGLGDVGRCYDCFGARAKIPYRCQGFQWGDFFADNDWLAVAQLNSGKFVGTHHHRDTFLGTAHVSTDTQPAIAQSRLEQAQKSIEIT